MPTAFLWYTIPSTRFFQSNKVSNEQTHVHTWIQQHTWRNAQKINIMLKCIYDILWCLHVNTCVYCMMILTYNIHQYKSRKRTYSHTDWHTGTDRLTWYACVHYRNHIQTQPTYTYTMNRRIHMHRYIHGYMQRFSETYAWKEIDFTDE